MTTRTTKAVNAMTFADLARRRECFRRARWKAYDALDTTQVALAGRIGKIIRRRCSQSAVSQMLNGVKRQSDVERAFAEIVGLPESELFEPHPGRQPIPRKWLDRRERGRAV